MDPNAEIQPTADDHAGPVLDADSSPEPPAAALAVAPSKVILPQQYPAWTDGHGWNQPQQYKTIQVGDIDGDGFDELIGRGPNGIEVYKWGQTTHIWEPLSVVGPFSDKDGWTTPDRYLNIILADINGDRKAELIGLNGNKLQVYSWDVTNHVWNEMSGNAALPNWWNLHANSRIYAADLKGEGKAELLIHDVEWLGKLTWDSNHWGSNNETSLRGRGLLPDVTILLGDLDGDGKAEIVISDMYKFLAFRWNPGQSWENALLDMAPLHSPGARKWLVQLADVDGDGKAEVILRSHGRLFYDLPCVQKLTHGSNGEEWQMWNKTPIEGLHTPPYFSTAQFADIDGDGKAELIARNPMGLNAWRYKFEGPLEQIAADTYMMTDADGWNAPQCYLTIQTARIGGDDKGFAKFAVIGRGPDGIQTWQWSADTGPAKPLPGGAVAKLGFRTTAVNGFYQPTEPGFPDYSNSPGQLRAYQLLSQYLLDVVADVWPPAGAKPELQDIRGAYTNTEWESHWVDWAGKLTALKDRQVEGVSPGDFEAVRHQLHTELIYVDCTYIWFGNTKAVLNQLFPAEALTVTIIGNVMAIPPDYTVKVLLDIASVVATIVGAIVAVVMGVAIVASGSAAAPIAIPAIAAATALIAMSLRVSSSYAGNGGNALELEVRHVRETLLTTWMRAPEANDDLMKVFLQHWGFLRQLGEKITSGQLVWETDLTSKMVVQGRRAYELSVWRTLAPSTWMVIGYDWAEERNDGVPKYGLWYDDKVHKAKWLLIQSWKGIGRQYNDIQEATLERVFGKPDDNPTSPLGVPVEDVMLARNGWKLPYDTGYDLPLPPPQDPPWLLLRSRFNPPPRRLT